MGAVLRPNCANFVNFAIRFFCHGYWTVAAGVALRRWLDQPALNTAALLVLCTKHDLAGARSADEMAELLGVVDVAPPSRRRHVQACSAVTGAGLRAGFDALQQASWRRLADWASAAHAR